MTYRVVTTYTHSPKEEYYFFGSFVKSLRGHEPFILDKRLGKWGGLATKTKWLRQVLKDNLIKEDILIVCDCFDFVFARSLDALVANYRRYDASCVISAERDYWPEEGLKPHFDEKNFPTPFKYINSGLVVAERDALVVILENMDLDNYPDDHQKEDGTMFHSNDQFLYQNEFVKQVVPIAVDYQCILNQTLSGMTVEDFDFLVDEMIRNKFTGSYPCSFHANGGSKTSGIVPPILKHLDLL